MRPSQMITRRLMWSAIAIPLMAALLAAAATFLPDDPYQRYQQLQGTIYDTVRWSYERMHFDPRPIDVAIVGDSRTRLGLRASQIQARLAADGKPAEVINTSFVGDGRNSQWLYVRELFRTKRPKVIVVAIGSRPHPWGHDTFRYIAAPADVWREAAMGLYNGPKDLLFLPYRQINLFIARFAPGGLGWSRTFDRASYSSQNVDFTHSYLSPDKRWIDMDRLVPRLELEKEVREHRHAYTQHSKLPAKLRTVSDADDRVYTRMIADEARRHGAKVLFVYIPGWAEAPTIQDRAFYEKLGTIQENLDLRGQDRLYQGWAHVNSAGAVIVSDRLADRLAELLP
jgi:hypothetical protein